MDATLCRIVGYCILLKYTGDDGLYFIKHYEEYSCGGIYYLQVFEDI